MAKKLTVEDQLATKAAQASKTGGEEEKPYKYPEGWKKPKTLGFAADALWNTRNARLALQKQVDELANAVLDMTDDIALECVSQLENNLKG